jgi:hypothetical protein
MIQREAVTDDSGRFECAQLPAGRYLVYVRPEGPFLTPASERVELAEGATATLTFRLVRGGSIAGRVVDDEGQPVVKAQVAAVLRRSLGGSWMLTTPGSGGRAPTDDRGHFRLYGLPPGDYYVSATPSAMLVNAAPRRPGGEAQTGYVPTFYPAAASTKEAQLLTLALGQETSGIDITLARARLGSVSGRATDATGAILSPQRGWVSLIARRDANPGPVGVSRLGPDGSFVISNVPPGRYLLSAQVRQESGPASRLVEAAYKPIDVDGDDVMADIQTNLGASVSGRVVIEGTSTVSGRATPGTAGRPLATVYMRSLETTMAGGSTSADPVSLGEDLAFQVKGVRGTLLPTASGPGMALKSVSYNGREITRTGLSLTGVESIDGVIITMTTDTAAVEGAVRAGAGEPADAWVVVFPEDSSQWFPGSPFVRVAATQRAAPVAGAQGAPLPGPVSGRSASSMQAGGFSVPGLLPGRYAVAAVARAHSQFLEGGSPPPTDPESLARLLKLAKMVSAAAGDTATLQLAVRK